MRKILLAALATAALSGLSPAHAATVDFSGLAGNVANPLTIGDMTFSNVGFNWVSGSEALCPSLSPANGANCSNDLVVSFAGTASGISFTYLFNNNITIGDDIGDVQIFSGATLLGTVDVLVLDTDAFTRDLVSLGGFSNVTRLVISSTDLGGVGYDDFTATITPRGAVPEPASWALMIGGFALAGGVMRRRAMGMKLALN